MSFFSEALHNLKPNLIWKTEGDEPSNESEFKSRVSVQTGKIDSLVLFDDSISTIDIEWTDVQEEMNRLKSVFDANEYARNRKAEYPDWSVQLEKIYDDGLTKWKSEMIDPVKAKYPKP